MSTSSESSDNETSRPLILYSRAQLLHLSKSPLNAPPPGMPELKDWFGTDTDHQAHKRDSEPATPNRERRTRREPDDTDSPSRPSFRSALSQPSQMGNFKHHSIRGSERDERDREGNDRLRNLSDKYDRGLTVSVGALRTKERDSTSRSGTQAQLTTIASRRTEARETKKKNGELSEDWRSKARDEKSNRSERNRSRPRDSSRPPREPSPSRRDKDRDDRDRRRSDRDNNDDDDTRRWKDDGKRDERIAARRERERDRQREKDTHDSSRWTTVDDSSRDSRNKRIAREKRTQDDKEQERQPAWMETYTPADDSPAILGGQPADGQLDGIQAWKKGMQEKEQQEKAKSTKSGNMDEIQMFRLMMVKEQRKDENSDGASPDKSPAPTFTSAPKQGTEPSQSPSAAPGPSPEFVAVASTSRFFPKPVGNKLADDSIPAPSPRPISQASNPSTFVRPTLEPTELPPAMAPNHLHLRNHDLAPTHFEEALLHGHRPPSAEGHISPSQRIGLPLNDPALSSEGMKGSRFARFFDANKAKEQPHQARPNIPFGQNALHPDMSGSRPHAMDDIFSMLNNSAHVPRPPQLAGSSVHAQMSSPAPAPAHFPPQAPNQPPLLPSHAQQLLADARLDSFYDNRSDDRSFVPDGMVPGLRTAPPPRDRLYAEALEDLRYHNHRLPVHQRAIDPLYSGQSGFPPPPPPPARTMNAPLNQPQFRGGPSPLLQGQGQRFPPGLANLGGRPPHEPSQILGLQNMHSGAGIGLAGSGIQQQQQQQQQQQPFNVHSFNGGGRGHVIPQQQMASTLLPNMMSTQSHIDLRIATQQQLLAMNASNASAMRSGNFGPQQGGLPQLSRQHPQLAAQMLQQQQSPQPLGPQHAQHDLGLNQPAQDLMALLMGGPRE